MADRSEIDRILAQYSSPNALAGSPLADYLQGAGHAVEPNRLAGPPTLPNVLPREMRTEPLGQSNLLDRAMSAFGQPSLDALRQGYEGKATPQEIARTFLETGPVGPFGMLVGPAARTANHAALRRAEEMAATGANRDAIWKETGWFQGTDGKWRFEIDDTGLSTQMTTRNEPGQIRHPELERAYPESATRDVNVQRGLLPGGSYRMPPWGIPEISVSGPTTGARNRAAAHELQHDVQRREGWPSGTYREDPAYWSNPGEIEARNAARRHRMTDEQRRETPPWRTEDAGTEPKWISIIESLRARFGR